jgi:hypothetical protein
MDFETHRLVEEAHNLFNQARVHIAKVKVGLAKDVELMARTGRDIQRSRALIDRVNSN